MAYNKKAHLRDNIEAIRLMFRLEKEQRTATPEEAGILAAYSGFGGIKAVLSPFGKLTDILRWTQADRELFPLITELHNVLRDGAADEREYKRLVESVKASTFTAFYAAGHYRRHCFFFGRTRGIARPFPRSFIGNRQFCFSLPTAMLLRIRQLAGNGHL